MEIMEILNALKEIIKLIESNYLVAGIVLIVLLVYLLPIIKDALLRLYDLIEKIKSKKFRDSCSV
jgi:hypothetical protein